MLHPGDRKQSVSTALAIFHETTNAALVSYFPDRQDSAQFLSLFSIWWTISNSKSKFNSSNNLGNAAVHGDGKPQFLRAFADWLLLWQSHKLPCSEKFTLTAQTNEALVRTMRCHAALIEETLQSGTEYFLTARLQSDPLERRYGQYRQMSGGRFLVSLKEVICSENILKMKSLLKEGCDIDDAKTEEQPDMEESLASISEKISSISLDNLTLNEQSKEVVVYISGYIALKVCSSIGECCSHLLFGECNNSEYLQTLSRGGLKSPSQVLCDHVCEYFAMLDASYIEVIQKSSLPARVAAEHILTSQITTTGLACSNHEFMASNKINRIICNVFLNNARKRKTSSVIKDKVQAFKRSKREK